MKKNITIYIDVENVKFVQDKRMNMSGTIDSLLTNIREREKQANADKTAELNTIIRTNKAASELAYNTWYAERLKVEQTDAIKNRKSWDQMSKEEQDAILKARAERDKNIE